MIRYRIEPDENLDYRLGFGIDFELLHRVINAKKRLGEDLPERKVFDNRTGYAIDSTPFNNTYHPIFQFDIYDSEKERTLQIDGYSQCFYYGEYWQIIAVDVETRSHTVILWENVSCKSPDFSEKIEENKKRFELVKAKKCRWLPNGDPNPNNQ